MDDKERLQILENALAHMLRPVRDVPFSVVIKSLAGQKVIRIDKSDPEDAELLRRLETAIRLCGAELGAKPIRRSRPNEVGNDVEAYVMRALPSAGLRAERPASKGGLAKAVGYPDILLRDGQNRATYIE